MGRRANGEGSVCRRKDGRYEGAAYFLTTSGQRKRVRVYGKTRREAHDKLVAAKTQAQAGIAIPDKSWKLGEYLDYWLGSIIRPNRRPATYEQYEWIVRLHLKPVLGGQFLNRLSVQLIQRFVNNLLSEGHSVRKVQLIRGTLSAALTRAVREELLVRNVARLVDLRSGTGPRFGRGQPTKPTDSCRQPVPIRCIPLSCSLCSMASGVVKYWAYAGKM